MSLSKKIIGRFLLAVMVVLSVVAVGCQTRTDDVEVGTLQRVSQAPYVFEPHIAVDPTNPDHLAAIVISVTDFECARGCKWRLLLYTSTDGGGTWTEQEPFGFARFSGDGVVGFGPDGTLYAVGLTGGGKVAMARFDADGQTTPSSVDFIINVLGQRQAMVDYRPAQRCPICALQRANWVPARIRGRQTPALN